jgi:hypothetical protein
MTVNIDAKSEQLIETCRIIAKHLTALADELELAGRDEPEPEA